MLKSLFKNYWVVIHDTRYDPCGLILSSKLALHYVEEVLSNVGVKFAYIYV